MKREVYEIQVKKALDTTLVLHGGSGLSEQDFKNSIREGITKMNIFTDLYTAGLKVVNEGGEDYHVVRTKKVAAIKEAVMNKILMFGSNDRA